MQDHGETDKKLIGNEALTRAITTRRKPYIDNYIQSQLYTAEAKVQHDSIRKGSSDPRKRQLLLRMIEIVETSLKDKHPTWDITI